MERLTTNKEVSEMNIIELAYNSCYGKDGNARYRDFETDIDARELAIKLLEEHADIPNEFTCDDDFDDFIADSLQYGTDDILGLIAVFYRNLWAMANLRGRLKYYEDLQEQGKLLKLPCAVGDKLYYPVKHENRIAEFEITEIQMFKDETVFFDDSENMYHAEDFGKDVFLTKEQAESALKEREGKE